MAPDLKEKQTIDKINAIKERLGDQLIILTHHYQRKEIVRLGDYKGDSFGLSQKAAQSKSAKHIVFCGVHFMAESARIISRPDQTVQIPDVEAGCWMADMADDFIVTRAFDECVSILGQNAMTPMVYMNSDAVLKAFTGENGGIVCTSSNAPAAFKWAFSRREKIFFFPDQHLGHNTALDMGIKPDQIIVWDPHKPLGGNTADTIKKAGVILWKGYCLVHTRFKTDHILKMKKKYPDARVVVHPECTRDVVEMADATGSTSFIVKYVKQAPKGSTIIVGTEINLIERLAQEYPDKTVLPLLNSLCPNMYKIDLEKLLLSLEQVGKHNIVTVPEKIKTGAFLALERMLSL